MLLKCSSLEPGKGKGKLARTQTVMRMTMSTGSTMTSRVHRKVLRIPSKRHPGKALPPGSKLHSAARIAGKVLPGKRLRPQQSTHCDNSNDSGLGYDQYADTPYANIKQIPSTRITPISRPNTRPGVRRTALGSQILNAPNNNVGVNGAVTLQSQIGAISQNGKCQLQILAQPEQQHRARYQTEGSRGAVKDRSGNGFPIVKLLGYARSATLQIFIGTDVGRVSPHMFYQACKVSGKNSTPCNEKKMEGTILIEIDLKSENEMTATCDCVGILKERNVDVEHRFPDQTAGPRSKKKSTRCRMVFRTQITHDDGTIETLQVCSQQIICTQPPGVPEICKKSLVSCPANGGLELFIIGKNFLKDTRVIFQARRLLPSASDTFDTIWEESVFPDKEYLQQTHLICTVPAYCDPDIVEPVTVQMIVTSSNKFSEPHNFVYTPKSAFGPGGLSMASTLASLQQHAHSNNIQDLGYGNEESRSMSPTPVLTNASSTTCNTLMLWANHLKEASNKIDAGIMPPPSTTLPLNIRRTSMTGLMSCGVTDQSSPPILKAEILDENSQNSLLSANGDNSLEYVNDNSMDCTTSASLMPPQSALDIMSNPFQVPPSSLMSMQSTSPINVVDLSSRVKQEGDLPSPMPDLGNPNLREESAKLIAAAGTGSSFMEPFCRSKLNDLKVQVNDVPMFSAPPADVMLGTNLSLTSLNTDSCLQQAIAPAVFGQQSMMPDANGTSNTNMNHMLSFPNVSQTIASNCLTTNTTPLTGDVMLNSQSMPTMNTSPNALLNVDSGSVSSIETDIIMTSPTLLCSQNTADAGALITSPGSIGSDNPLLTPPQPNSGGLLNNLIQPMSIKQSDAAMKNMILNAAAEILSSEPNSITPETTTNALMSFNTEQAQSTTPQHASPPSITNILTHSDSTSSVVVLAGNNKLIQNVVAAAAAQNASDIIQNQVVNAEIQFSGNFQPTQIVNFQPTTTAASAAVANLSQLQQNLLNNIQQEISAVSTETVDEIGNTKQRKLSDSMGTDQPIVPIVPIVPVVAQTNGAGSATAATASANPQQTGNIPQDLTIMSDNDLIRYINPSCFDQVQL